MAAGIEVDQIDGIGEVAGVVWDRLNEHGPVALSRLAKEIDAPRDLVMQGIGWLAREGKVKFQEGSRGRLISLC